MMKFLVSLLLLIATSTGGHAIDTPAAVVTATTTGPTAALSVDSSQGLPLTVMVAAPGTGTLRVEGAPTSRGPWIAYATVITNAASYSYDASGVGVLSVASTGYSFSLPYIVPFLRLNVVSLTGGTATMGVSQPAIH